MRTLLLLLLVATAPKAQTPEPVRPPATFAMADFGVVADSTVDNTPAIQRSLNAAARDAVASGRNGRAEWTDITAPCGVIGYQGQVTIPTVWLRVRGCGGAAVTTATDDRGTVFHPVRAVAREARAGTRFRLLDGAVGRPQPTVRGEMVNRWTGVPYPLAIYTTRLAARRATPGGIALVDIALDGNWRGNLDAFNAHTDAWKESYLRNAPGWTGLDVSNHDGLRHCDRENRPTRVEITRSAVTGFGASALLGNDNTAPMRAFYGPDRLSAFGQCVDWHLTEVLVGDALYNHTVYGAPGTWRDVTVTGFGWTQIVTTGDTDVRNLVYERPEHSPSGRDYDGQLLNPRSGYLTVHGMYADTRDREATGDSEDRIRMLVSHYGAVSVTVDSLVWRTGRALYAFQGGGQGARWSNVQIYPERGLRFLAQADPTRTGATRAGVIALERWQVATPPGTGEALVYARSLYADATITNSRLSGYAHARVGDAATVTLTDTDAPPFAAGTPDLPPIASPTGARRYRVETRRRCRDLRTGRRVSFVPHCSSLATSPRPSP